MSESFPIADFLGLGDTPDSYVSQATKQIRVKADETGLEFFTASAGVTDHGALTGLQDDDHNTVYVALAGRAGTANDLTISTTVDGTIVGSTNSAGSKGLTLRANTGGLNQGPIVFHDGIQQVGKFTNTSSGGAGWLVTAGASTTGVAGIQTETASFVSASTNGNRYVAIQNTSAGALATSGFRAYQDQGRSVRLTIASDAGSSIAELRTDALAAGGAIRIRTANSPIEIWTTEVKRWETLASSNTIQGNEGLTIEGGSGVHTLTLIGGAGVASTLRLGLVAGNLIGFHGTAAVAQHSTTGQTAGFTQNTLTAVLDGSTFTGGTGATAYTIGDVVRALKLKGLMAA